MRAGRLDRIILIQRKTTSADSFGEPIETWATVATVWAEMVPVRGQERYAAMQQIAEIDTVFRIRYRAGITPLDRISYNSRLYDIKHVLEIGRFEGLELMTRTRAE